MTTRGGLFLSTNTLALTRLKQNEPRANIPAVLDQLLVLIVDPERTQANTELFALVVT